MIAPPARDRRRRRALGCGLALLAASGGCSFKIIKPPPPASEWPSPSVPSTSERACTNIIGIPILDTIVASGLGVIAYRERVFDQTSNEVLLAAGALPFLASAIYGYVETARCSRYQASFRQAPP
jgi:hypothetical protein